jgi:hypothetical protein
MKEEGDSTNKLIKNINPTNPSLFDKIRKKFFQFVFHDTGVLFRILYHKYFSKEVFYEINKLSTRKIASDMNLQNELKIKMKENLIYPAKKLVEEKLEIPNLDDYDESKFKEFEIEKKSKEYLKEYISICKFNWMNNITTFSFFCLLGFSCVFFKYHRKHKKLSNRMFIVIALQIMLNGTCIYLSVRAHPDEMFLQETYAKQLEKYKIIFKE